MHARSSGAARWFTGATPTSRLLLIGLGCLLLALVPPEALDHLAPLCLWRRLLGWCPACGTTHALAALLHGQLQRALHYNLNVLIVAPLLAGMVVRDLWSLEWGA